jgi:hypothetical protein
MFTLCSQVLYILLERHVKVRGCCMEGLSPTPSYNIHYIPHIPHTINDFHSYNIPVDNLRSPC